VRHSQDLVVVPLLASNCRVRGRGLFPWSWFCPGARRALTRGRVDSWQGASVSEHTLCVDGEHRVRWWCVGQPEMACILSQFHLRPLAMTFAPQVRRPSTLLCLCGFLFGFAASQVLLFQRGRLTTLVVSVKITLS